MNPEELQPEENNVELDAIAQNGIEANDKLANIEAGTDASAQSLADIEQNTEAQILEQQRTTAAAQTPPSVEKAADMMAEVLEFMQGPTGETGPQGEKGDKGDKGDTGADSTVAGPQGVQGEKGDTGPTGPRGPKGAKGARGPAGPASTAKDGKDGKDAETPVKGKDYFTKEEIEEIQNAVFEEVGPLVMRNVASKTYDLREMADMQGATTGQIPVKQADGSWAPATAAGSGDMLVATYDPTAVAGDAFDMDNMVEGTNLILTGAERTLIASALQAADISDTAYGAGWNGDTGAASKNAIYDKIETLGGGGDLLADGTVPLTANWDVGAFTITGTQFISDITTGTAPLVVASTTLVTNLNADQLDGNEATAFATAAQGSTADSALQNVVEDTTPQLGGDLDVNGNKITSVTNGNIEIEPNGTGEVVISNGEGGLNADLSPLEVNSDATNVLIIGAHGTGAIAGVNTYHSRGTTASPTATQSGDSMYFMGARGYGATTYNSGSKGGIVIKASENYTDTANGTEITFETTPNLSTTRAEQMQLDDGGLSLTTGNTYQINDTDVLSATALGTAVVGSSLTSVGTLSSGNVDAAVSAASTTVAGKIELATDAEFTTGTDTSRAVTADQVASIAQTMTNKRITPRVGTTASSSSLTIDSDSYDHYTVTALAAAMTINAPSGTETDGQRLVIRIKDNATARALTWNAAFRALGTTLPTTTVISKTMYIGCMWNSADSKWDVIAVAEEA